MPDALGEPVSRCARRLHGVGAGEPSGQVWVNVPFGPHGQRALQGQKSPAFARCAAATADTATTVFFSS
jgi:hypothetical protein